MRIRPNIKSKSTNQTNIVKSLAYKLGFDDIRITSAKPFDHHREVTLKRIDAGLMEGLDWYTEERVERGTNPESILPGALSIISLSLNYFIETPQNQEIHGPTGKIAKYAWGHDYHKVMGKKLKLFIKELTSLLGRNFASKSYVDTGPMLDRSVAERSGLGWYGKHTNIITADHGSWVFLGQIITDLDLSEDQPLKKNCGSCQICIVECPTQAIIAPYVLDNKRCISFLTIESKGSIPKELRRLMGDWVFGCDICQDVCPVNHQVQPTKEPLFQPGEHGFNSLSLIPLLDITQEEFDRQFKTSPIKRAKRIGLIRNVCVALGNIGDTEAVEPLGRTLNHEDPLIREHAAWALSQIGTPKAVQLLVNASLTETDREVKNELLNLVATKQDD
ncbi:MAG: tRNA epoxyqueuosine(34) reductase QueG [SAR202 cluster bacterium]|nr:tRNA epoxyqueuosine(34) reductase QueG [SAR202 cluster bacterium]|tara:strand:- start:8390 stop:9559 length:1170 start_codon:yes stop_codon:yes gene_type:complete